MSHLIVICSHCGSELAIQAPAPAPANLLDCRTCGRAAPYATWVATTERELAAQLSACIHDVSRYPAARRG